MTQEQLEAIMAAVEEAIDDFDDWEFISTPMSLNDEQFDAERSKRNLIALIKERLSLT